jgi:HSP20 family molecular chaperone IbpA
LQKYEFYNTQCLYKDLTLRRVFWVVCKIGGEMKNKKYVWPVIFLMGTIAGVYGTLFFMKTFSNSKKIPVEGNITRKKITHPRLKKKVPLKFKSKSQEKKYQRNQKAYDGIYDSLFNDGFFEHKSNPFKEIQKMRKEMNVFFEDRFGDFDSNFYFDNWYSDRIGGEIGEITKTEEDKFFYYKINLKGLDRDTVKVNIKNKKINISGSYKKVISNKSAHEVFESTVIKNFQRIFSTPFGVDEKKIEFETKEDEIVIKFPKKEVVNI